MLESTVQLRHADSLASAAAMLKPGTRTILVADLRGLSPEDFAPISGSPHNPVVIAIRDSASAGMVDALMLEGAIHALVDSPVEAAADAARRQRCRAYFLDRRSAERRDCPVERAAAVKKNPASRR